MMVVGIVMGWWRWRVGVDEGETGCSGEWREVVGGLVDGRCRGLRKFRWRFGWWQLCENGWWR